MFWMEEHTLRFRCDRFAINFLFSSDGVCSSLISLPAARANGIDDVLDQHLPTLPRPPLGPFGMATVTARID